MRVGIFTNNYLPMRGGVSSAVLTLSAGLARLGHQVWVVAPRACAAGADLAGVIRVPSIPAPTYPDFALPVPWSRRLSKTIATLGLDVFHAQHPFLLGGAALRLARRADRPLVFTYHTHYEKYAHYVPLWQGLVERLAVCWSSRFANRADLVIAPSQAVSAILRRRGVRAPIEVVPTGVPLDLFAPGDRAGARAALGIAPTERLLLYVGRLDPEKNLALLLEAFALVAEVIPEARLLFVGQGTEAPGLRARAQALPARDRIRFVGARAGEGLPDYYRAADLFCFTSETETQGLALAEAQACGLPAVAVTAAGLDEVVEDGKSGLLVKSEARAFAEAVVGLLMDPPRRDAMGVHAREVAVRRFDAEIQTRRIAELYRRVLEARAS